jgi:hypothetical protein
MKLRKIYSTGTESLLSKGDDVIVKVVPKGESIVGEILDYIEDGSGDSLVLAVKRGLVDDSERVKAIAKVYNGKLPNLSIIPSKTILQITLLKEYAN